MSIAAGGHPLAVRTGGLSTGRSLSGIVIVGLGVLLLVERSVFRGFEAAAAALLSGLATRSHDVVQAGTSTYFVNVGTPQVFGVAVTPECSAAIVTGGIVMAVGATMAFTGVTVARSLVAGAVAAAFFIGVNLCRLVIVTYSSDRWGLNEGYHWSHVWVGTAITIFGGTLTILLFIAVLAGGRTRRNSTED